MKTGVIVYHKNINSIYPAAWVQEFKHSIINQSYKLFDIYEMNYGGTQERIFENSIYESKELPTFVHAMNYLIEKCLNEGCDAVGNTNCDDNFSLNRLKIQLPYIEDGYDVVGSNFSLVIDNEIFKTHKFDNLDIKEQLGINHNILSHPSIVYSRKFLEENRYEPNEIPLEDLLLWKRTIHHYKFKIVPEILLYHRIHNNSVCKSSNR